MAILNKKFYYNIESDGQHKLVNTANITLHSDIYPQRLLTKNYDDRDYWYIEFLNDDSFFLSPLEKLIPPEILDKIRQGEITLLLCNAHEAYHAAIDSIYKDIVIRLRIPPKQILLVSMSHDAHKEIEMVSKKHNHEKIHADSLQEFEFLAKWDYLTLGDKNKFAKNTLQDKVYEKKYLSYNGMWRTHRLSLISLLISFKILDKGYVSFNSMPIEFNSGEVNYNSLFHWHRDNVEFIKLLEENKEEIINTNRIYLDTTPETHADMANYSKEQSAYYENTYFSIVTETLCDRISSAGGFTVGRSLSEKIYKPIVNRHPFLLLTVPKSLEKLREMGYKTFSPFVDESYDDEIDDTRRVLKLAKEVQRLANLSPTELTEFLKFAKPIVEHNFQTIINKNVWCYNLC